ncbi:hypothetical protein PHYSODRAFT_523224 [Phytophthora sojae]|uniref:Fucosyltransferase n=1 Tax=Phytophthora sojae (strain P6497) TaxID=1094619 RepID=G5A4Y2_PHYSP|nr:hypothetical protein PHYSODRAFT_523224 [Phytophthora sojae]EGZ09731.1 hypothetical protein PHYSODRAFT_523224 [Phytophthora sojae]|eukprot:XP_009534592.1 hypothetical protein PHYSODRAFT_523224 [Phytophthora sojae]
MYTRSVCSRIRAHTPETDSQPLICPSLDDLQAQLQQKFRRLEASRAINRAFMELWRYSLFDSDPELPPFIIAYSDNAVFSSIVLECLFVIIHEPQKRPILVMPESTLHEYYGGTPDVYVFSILDGDCDPVARPACQEGIAQHFRNYGQGPKPATIMMVAGEPISTQGLDERVILLSTVSVVDHERHVYFSVASNSFAERLDHSPTALLSPSPAYMEQEAVDSRRFCAYLYARCDRPQREYMFDVLNAMEPVDALGICAGSSRLPDASYGASRYSDWYNDDAVTTFQRYKFVIAFENSGVPGYVTEKLVNPFLAGSIPIYLGNSTTVSELFNPNSFIDCGRFERLRDCADYVVKVHRSPELYDQMQREPPIRDVEAFNEAFSWHPSVPSRDLADKVAKLMQIT